MYAMVPISGSFREQVATIDVVTIIISNSTVTALIQVWVLQWPSQQFLCTLSSAGLLVIQGNVSLSMGPFLGQHNQPADYRTQKPVPGGTLFSQRFVNVVGTCCLCQRYEGCTSEWEQKPVIFPVKIKFTTPSCVPLYCVHWSQYTHDKSSSSQGATTDERQVIYLSPIVWWAWLYIFNNSWFWTEWAIKKKLF